MTRASQEPMKIGHPRRPVSSANTSQASPRAPLKNTSRGVTVIMLSSGCMNLGRRYWHMRQSDNRYQIAKDVPADQ